MKKLPDNYFDLIITDPPYAINIGSKVRGDKPFGSNKVNVGGSNICKVKEYIPFDDSKIPSKEVFNELKRVSKNQIIFGGNYFIEYLSNSPCWIVWDKDNSGNFADCELAYTSFSTAVRKFKYRWNGMLQERMNWKEKRYHPTQKPVALGRWLLEKYANKGDLIFDPFAGSGSFLLACKQKGFNFVGCELIKDYCDIIKERLSQPNLINYIQKQNKLNEVK